MEKILETHQRNNYNYKNQHDTNRCYFEHYYFEHYSKDLICINSLNPHNNPTKQELTLSALQARHVRKRDLPSSECRSLDSNPSSLASEAILIIRVYYNLEPGSLKTCRKIWIGHITIGAITRQTRADKTYYARTTVRIRASCPGWGWWWLGSWGEQMS